MLLQPPPPLLLPNESLSASGADFGGSGRTTDRTSDTAGTWGWRGGGGGFSSGGRPDACGAADAAHAHGGGAAAGVEGAAAIPSPRPLAFVSGRGGSSDGAAGSTGSGGASGGVTDATQAGTGLQHSRQRRAGSFELAGLGGAGGGGGGGAPLSLYQTWAAEGEDEMRWVRQC
uniref:Uncharacterized protein n=1 Tax=Chlamydomonas euryale TaxID=1486919 RepID=A0A7R9VWN6_9CHLO